jgi:hypothetical protein
MKNLRFTLVFLLLLFSFAFIPSVVDAASPPPLTSISVFVYRSGIMPADKIMAEVTETGITTTRTVKAGILGGNMAYATLEKKEPLPYAGANPITGYRLTYFTGFKVSQHKGKTISVTAQGYNSQTSQTITTTSVYTIPY